jgi:DNA transposition AAA+ family ATPase
VPYYQNHQFTPKPLAMSDIINENSKTGQQNNFSTVNNYYENSNSEQTLIAPQKRFREIVKDKSQFTKVHTLLGKSNVILYGTGGIGKTTFAKTYIGEYGNKYAFVEWIDVTEWKDDAAINTKFIIENLAPYKA